MIVLVLLMALLSLGIPAFSRSFSAQDEESTISNLASWIDNVRTHAVTSNQPILLVLTPHSPPRLAAYILPSTPPVEDITFSRQPDVSEDPYLHASAASVTSKNKLFPANGLAASLGQSQMQADGSLASPFDSFDLPKGWVTQAPLAHSTEQPTFAQRDLNLTQTSSSPAFSSPSLQAADDNSTSRPFLILLPTGETLSLASISLVSGSNASGSNASGSGSSGSGSSGSSLYTLNVAPWSYELTWKRTSIVSDSDEPISTTRPATSTPAAFASPPVQQNSPTAPRDPRDAPNLAPAKSAPPGSAVRPQPKPAHKQPPRTDSSPK